MKKGVVFKTNCVIFAMLIMLVGVLIGNAKTINVKADNRVIYVGDTSKNNICLMINVYQGEKYVENILELLDKFNVKTTFFIGGCWATKNIDLVKKIYAKGHELANHGFYHKDQDELDFDENLQEIQTCHQVVERNIGVKMNLFAPPSGAYNSVTVDAATSLNYRTIMWTHDTIDWRDQDDDIIFKRATKNMANGDLILMHPTRETVVALAEILAFVENNGFVATTVSNCLDC